MGQQQVVMELKWQQAFHSVRPLPPRTGTGRATGEGWMAAASEDSSRTGTREHCHTERAYAGAAVCIPPFAQSPCLQLLCDSSIRLEI